MIVLIPERKLNMPYWAILERFKNMDGNIPIAA